MHHNYRNTFVLSRPEYHLEYNLTKLAKQDFTEGTTITSCFWYKIFQILVFHCSEKNLIYIATLFCEKKTPHNNTQFSTSKNFDGHFHNPPPPF